MSKSPSIRLVVLDWAGTTIDFGSQAPTGAFVKAFAAKNVPVSIAAARAPMGLHKKDHIREMLKVPELAAKWQAIVGHAWTEADVEELYRLVTPMQVEAAKVYSQLIPGTLDCAAILRSRGIKIGASTGYFQEAADAVYAAAAQQGFVPDFTICADQVPAGRPAPWMIFRVMEALNVYPITSVVKVGDTLVDIEDGRNAGVWSVGVIDSSNVMGLSEAEFAALSETERTERRAVVFNQFRDAGAHAVIRSIAQLPELLEQFNKMLEAGQQL